MRRNANGGCSVVKQNETCTGLLSLLCKIANNKKVITQIPT